MWHIFMKHTYKDTHREPYIVLLRWGISMMKQNLKQTMMMMMMMKCFDYDFDEDDDKADSVVNDGVSIW